MADEYSKQRRLFEEDRGGFAFRELFTPDREGPLPPRPHRSGKGGPSINQTPPPPVLSPVNTAAPVASGALTIGSTLSCTQGTWTNSPTSYAYQWLRGGTNIPGATSSTYLTVTADGGTSVSCAVTATNASGNGSATSNALSIAAGGPSAQALAYLARTVGGNEGGNATNIAALIDGLVADGVWAKLDALYVLAQQNQTDALLNLVGTSYGLTSVGLLRSVTFTSFVGFGGFGATIYLDTGLDPSIASSPKYTTNDASFSIWSYQILSTPNAQGGRSDSTAIYNKFSDGNFIASVNGAGFPRTPTLITKGLFSAERRDAANVYPYQNGVSAGAVVNASGADTGNFEIGHIGGSGAPNYTDQTLSAAHIGASLGVAGQLALYNRLRTYMTAIGVP